MNVVVTGGTGFIGRKLVRALTERGEDVTVLSRDVGRAKEALGEGVTVETWGPEPPRAGAPWIRAITEADAVVHLAGAGIFDERWSDERLRVIRSSRVDSTVWLAEAIAQRPPRVWVSGSAVGVYGMNKDDDVVDEQGEHGNDVLARICEAWEGATATASKAGVRVALARTGIVLGAEGGVLAKMLPPFKAFVGGPIGDGKQWVSWIHWRDVVRALLFAIDKDEVTGPFNVTAPKPVTMNELARALGEALHRPSAFRVPALAVRAAFGPAAEAMLTGQRAVPAVLERAGFTFDFDEIGAALRDLVRSS